MAKTINELSLATDIDSTDYFVKCDTNGNTTKLQFSNLSSTVLDSIQNDIATVVNTNSQYNSIYYNNYLYIDGGGAYTKSYTAVLKCIVFYHLEWDCNGNDGVKLLLLKDDTLVAEIPVFSNFEGNNSSYLNVNGTVPLGEGMTIRFAPTLHNLNTDSGNHMNLLIATI